MFIGEIESLASARLMVISGLGGSGPFWAPRSRVPKNDFSLEW